MGSPATCEVQSNLVVMTQSSTGILAHLNHARGYLQCQMSLCWSGAFIIVVANQATAHRIRALLLDRRGCGRIILHFQLCYFQMDSASFEVSSSLVVKCDAGFEKSSFQRYSLGSFPFLNQRFQDFHCLSPFSFEGGRHSPLAMHSCIENYEHVVAILYGALTLFLQMVS